MDTWLHVKCLRGFIHFELKLKCLCFHSNLLYKRLFFPYSSSEYLNLKLEFIVSKLTLLLFSIFESSSPPLMLETRALDFFPLLLHLQDKGSSLQKNYWFVLMSSVSVVLKASLCVSHPLRGLNSFLGAFLALK